MSEQSKEQKVSWLREEIPLSAARGAKLLDAEMPGWFLRIDLEQLELNSCTRCVLGQMFPVEEPQNFQWNDGYIAGIKELGLEGSTPQQEFYGFDWSSQITDAVGQETWKAAELHDHWTLQWEREIIKRRMDG